MSNHISLEEWREKARTAAQLESAAHMLEEAKTAVLAQRKSQQGDIPDSHAERIVKASPQWHDYLERMVKAREAANLAEIEAKYLEMRLWEQRSMEARERAEMRLT